MPRSLIALVPLVAVSAALHAQPAGRTLSAAEQRADFDLLRRALVEAHGGFERWVPRAELDRRLDAHRARLERPASSIAFALVVSEAIAELRDGHARIELDSVTTRALAEARLLPLRVAIEGDRVVVARNDTPGDSTIRPGMALLSVNGRSSTAIVATLLPTVAGDGFIETGRRARLARELPRLHRLFVDTAETFDVVARDDGGRVVRARLAGVRDAERRTNANPVNATYVANLARLDGPPGNVALDFPADSVARLRVRAFAGNTFLATLDSAFEVVRARHVRAMILDLRGNGGGVDEWGANLVSRFVADSFRYFNHIHLRSIAPSFATWLPRTFESTRAGTVQHPGGGHRVTPALHSGVGMQAPAARPFLGPLAVLIDGGSFSTTADVAAQLRSMRRATFVGEETGGAYEGNTSGLNALVVLPASGLRMRIMMYDYWNAVTPPVQRGRGTLPEHPAVRTVAAVLAGRDPALERAVALASRP